MFELHYEPFIINDKLKTWEIAVVPWDTETFGFGVSVLNPMYDKDSIGNPVPLKNALEVYSESKRVDMITASIPAMQMKISFLLQTAGFRLIDTALSVRYENLHAYSDKDSTELSLTPVVPSEMEFLVDMAGTSFHHGRYHMDPRLPNALADRRYKDWISRSFDSRNPQQVLTAKVDGAICGFSVVECGDSRGYLHLHAIGSIWQGKKLGHEMISQSLRYLYTLGAKSVGTKISASNLRAINMHARLNGHFVAADRLLHWHREKENEL
ncbi:MAG: hypothetical protein OEV87_09250 [Phycisphaerae bacterium]|nr:hypothetical protein [Phycisphaerae bacterium]